MGDVVRPGDGSVWITQAAAERWVAEAERVLRERLAHDIAASELAGFMKPDPGGCCYGQGYEDGMRAAAALVRGVGEAKP